MESKHTVCVCVGWFKYITMKIMFKYADITLNTCMCHIYFGVQNTVSDGECVTVSAFPAQDSDITERIKGQRGQSVQISVSAYIMKSAQLEAVFLRTPSKC